MDEKDISLMIEEFGVSDEMLRLVQDCVRSDGKNFQVNIWNMKSEAFVNICNLGNLNSTVPCVYRSNEFVLGESGYQCICTYKKS